MKFDIYEMVKTNILNGIEQIQKREATATWEKPWSLQKVRPMNWESERLYSGVNLWLLNHSGSEFLTFKQIQELQSKHKEVKLKKGSKARSVVFFKWTKEEKDEQTDEVIKPAYPILRYYNVFSLDDIEGLELKRKTATYNHNPEEAESDMNHAIFDYFHREGIEVRFTKSAEAFYMPSLHSISVPETRYFEHYNRMLSTLAHEAIHSTAKALKRKLDGQKGSSEYAFEELVAEFGASLLLANFGVEDETSTENNVAYINSWMKALKETPARQLVSAMQLAQKAADYILGESTNIEVA